MRTHMAQALLIFKPDASYRLGVRSACWRWLSDNPDVEVKALRWYQAPRSLVEEHYGFLSDRPFYGWLLDFMTALPLLVGRLEASASSLEELRTQLGETIVEQARPGSLRQRLGILGGINCLHVSDSPGTGEAEVDLWSKHIALAAGVEDAPPLTSQDPDHTFQLRALAQQVRSGIHTELAAAEMRRLLRQETDLAEPEFEGLWRVIYLALSN